MLLRNDMKSMSRKKKSEVDETSLYLKMSVLQRTQSRK